MSTFKCRHSVKENNKYNLVMFGSYGKGNAIANEQYISLSDTFPKSITGTVKNQTFTVCYSSTNSSNWPTITFKNGVTIVAIIQCKKGENVIQTGIINSPITSIELTGSEFLNPAYPNYILLNKYYESKIWNANANDFYKIEKSYSIDSKAIADDLVQRLSIIKGELKSKPGYGIPLMEKVKNKTIYDSIIYDIMSGLFPYVKNIKNFTSEVKNFALIKPNEKYYHFEFTIETMYNELETISN